MMRHIFSESSPFLSKIYFCDAFCFLFFFNYYSRASWFIGWEKSKSKREKTAWNCALWSTVMCAHILGDRKRRCFFDFSVFLIRKAVVGGGEGGAGKSVKWKRFPGNFFGWNWFLHLGGERDLLYFIFYLLVNNFCKKLCWSSGKMVELGKETFIFLKTTIFLKWNRERKIKECESLPPSLNDIDFPHYIFSMYSSYI